MAPQTPVIRPVAWLAVIPGLIILFSLILLCRFILGPERGLFVGSMVYLTYSIASRRLVARHHRRGIRLVRKGFFAQAIPEFQASYDFFNRHIWIDRYRCVTLMSAGTMCYREMALANMAHCYGMAGDGAKSLEYYRRTLQEFPNNGTAFAALRLMESAQNAKS